MTLETCQWLYTSVASQMSALNFVDDQHWLCTTLGWSKEGRFLAWYVNFQRPTVRIDFGYDRTDLVIDGGRCAELRLALEGRSRLRDGGRARHPRSRVTSFDRCSKPSVSSTSSGNEKGSSARSGRLGGHQATGRFRSSPGLCHGARASRRRRPA